MAPRGGHGGNIAGHANAEAAVRAIGRPVAGDNGHGGLRAHVWAVIRHLVHSNPVPDGETIESHAKAIAAKLADLIGTHREEIAANIGRHGRLWSELEALLADAHRLALWEIEHRIPGVGRRKIIQRAKDRSQLPPQEPLSETRRRSRELLDRFILLVKRYWATVKHHEHMIEEEPWMTWLREPIPPGEMGLAAARSGKSTIMRSAAIEFQLMKEAIYAAA
jgi:hypothetical protein